MNYNFENIAGYTQEKEELMRLCEIFNNSNYYIKKGAQLPKGIIFYGASGNGKTLFAKVLADCCKLEIRKIDLTNVKKEGDVCKLIKLAFKSAKRNGSPTMIFLDEIDKILPNEREEYVTDQSKNVLVQLLTLIDGMDSTNTIFVATCNDYNVLPEPLVRPGRIDKKIYVSYPNYKSRLEILKLYYGKTTCQFETPMEEIASLCTNFSCASLETLVNECIMRSDKNNFVSKEIIQQVCYEIMQEDIPKKSCTITDQIAACNVVSKFIVAKALKLKGFVLKFGDETLGNAFLSSALGRYSNDDYDDDDEYYDDEDNDETNDADINIATPKEDFYAHICKQDFLNFITILASSFSAQEIVFNKTYNTFSGDCDNIHRLLLAMLRNGMFGLDLLFSYSITDAVPYPTKYDENIHELFTNTILSCYNLSKSILQKNVNLLKRLTTEMINKQILLDSDYDKIIDQFGGINT